MGAGAGRKEAAVLYKEQSLTVDLPVAPEGRLHGIPGLGKGRGIEDDNVVLLSGFALLWQVVEDIGDEVVDPVLEAVELCVLFCLFDRKVGGIDGDHVFCSCHCGVEAKGSGVGEQIEHLVRMGAHGTDGLTVQLLVEEEAGLLAVLYVHDVLHAVLGDRNEGVELLGEKSFRALEAFLFPDLRIAPLIDAADPDAVLMENLHKGCKDQALQAVRSKA